MTIDSRTGVRNDRVVRRPILTIASAMYNGFPELAMTYRSIVAHHREIIPDVDFLVVDNNPKSGHGQDAKVLFEKNLPNGHYAAVTPYSGTFVKDLVVRSAETEYVMVVDPHVDFAPDALIKLVRFLKSVQYTNDMFQGPLLETNGLIHATHMLPLFSKTNFGRWGTFRSPEMGNPDIYELPMHGTGMFVVRRDTWLGFNPAMHAFGSEEGYIHEKYRLAGRNVWSLPFLGWWHLFREHSRSIDYAISSEHKYRNHLIGWTEVSLPTDFVHKCWEGTIKPDIRKAIQANVESLDIVPMHRPEGQLPFLGYPIRNEDAPYNESYDYSKYEIPRFYSRQ